MTTIFDKPTRSRENDRQSITNEVQKQELENLITLIAIYLPDPGSFGNFLARPSYALTPSNDESTDYASFYESGNVKGFKFKPIQSSNSIVNFAPFPVEVSGIEHSATEASARPTLTVANITPYFDIEEVVGARVQIIQTFKKYQNTDISLPIQTYIIDRVAQEGIQGVVYELISPFDVQNVKLPRKRIVGGQCPFLYKGASTQTVGKQLLLASDRPTGGCTWPADNLYNTGSNVSSVFMNANDEYVISARLAPIGTAAYSGIPADQGIPENTYWYTTTTSYKINSIGVQESMPSIVYRYWQCIKTMGVADKEAPNESSPNWREVRVYKNYSNSVTYCAYVDSRFNDYVSYPIGGRTGLSSFYGEGGGLVEGYDFVSSYTGANEIFSLSNFAVYETTPTSAVVYATIPADNPVIQELLSNASPNQAIEYSYNKLDTIAPGTLLGTTSNSQQWINQGFVVWDPSGSYLSNLTVPSLNIPEGQLVISYDGTSYVMIIGAGDNTTLATNLNSADSTGILNIDELHIWFHSANANVDYITQIYQVKNKTLDPNIIDILTHVPWRYGAGFGEPITAFNSKNWIAGDQCSKTLNACVMRFQAAGTDPGAVPVVSGPLTWYMTPQVDVNLFNLEFPFEPNVGQDYMGYFKLDDQQLYDSLPDEGFVSLERWFENGWGKSYPAVTVPNPPSTKYYSTGGFDFQMKGPSNYGFIQAIPARYYFIKLHSNDVNGSPSINFVDYIGADDSKLTPSGRVPLFQRAGYRWNNPDMSFAHNSVSSATFDSLYKGATGNKVKDRVWRSGSDPVNTPGNVGGERGMVVYYSLPQIQEGSFAEFQAAKVSGGAEAYKAIYSAEAAPFQIEKGSPGGGYTEIGYLGGTPDGGFARCPEYTAGWQSFTTVGQLLNNDGSVPSPSIDADPETGHTFRWQFSSYEAPGTITISADLNSQVELPFGGFPGSRRFK